MNDLQATLKNTKALLLDFDGPVCSIFANHPAPKVAARLRRIITDQCLAVPAEIGDEEDPLEVLKWASTLGSQEILKAVEDGLCSEELEAASTSEPTPFSREVIVAAHEAGIALAIVSNNSSPAIQRYLIRERLDRYFVGVVGRRYMHPELMKPEPQPVWEAAEATRSHPGECVLIGDSLTDIYAARKARIPIIALANRARKVVPFEKASPNALVESMEPVASDLLGLAHH